MIRSTGNTTFAIGAVAAAVLLVATVPDSAAARPARTGLGRPAQHLSVANGRTAMPRLLDLGRRARPAGVPRSGPYAFLLRLRASSTLATYRRVEARGPRIAAAAARTQLATVERRQVEVVAALPHGSHVLYRTHSVLAGVAVETDARNYRALERMAGVARVYPIAPKHPATSYAVPLVGAPTVWSAHGNLGANETIAEIDTGIDYTHADFGGPGTKAAYQAALNTDAQPPIYPHPAKISRGHDFAGDSYNADPTTADFQPVPHPDSNPLDCAGHGSHVAGIAAGYGVTSGGATFTGDYSTLAALTTEQYQDTFSIGPGMAPQAKLIPYKVFGCNGSTNLAGKAIDWATDPNRDGNPADHVDVINLSLGSDYASPQDGDAVEANAASRLGVTVVAAAGNAGDEYDAAGSPADATRVIAVANTLDGYSQIDRLDVSFDGTPQDPLGAERSVLYKRWGTADLSGQVVRVTQSGNADGCSPVSQNLTGRVALVTWHDGMPACPSKTVAGHLHNAGAIGFILGSDAELFAGGINGNAAIPGVLVPASAASTIRSALTGGQTVTVTGTTANGFRQLLPRFNDTVDASSSRGTTAAGDVKPDVGAVGNSVFSVAMGSGNDGTSLSGTSMASPMVAGLAALVRAAHPGWTPEQVKADIMNTAGQDLYTRANHQGHVYAPNRVGAGRIRADVALDNQVLAYVRDDVGAVSVSFGPVEATGGMSRSKTVKVVNKSGTTASFALAYHAITSVPGVTYTLSRSSLTLAPGATGTFTVRLVINRFGAMTKTHDATLPLNSGTLAREFLADASGRVVLSPSGSYTGPALRVPVYSAPRPASRMTQAGTVTLRGGNIEKGGLRLSGSGLDRGSGATRIRAAVSGFELAARSGSAPTCRTPSATRCVDFADERSADLKYVGVTSDAPVVRRPARNATAYFSITTQRPWDTPVGAQEFDIAIDTNGDDVVDAVAYNTRLNGADVFLSELVDLTHPAHPFIRDDELINDRFGDVDTALFNSDTMVLPVWARALGRLGSSPALPGFTAQHSRIRYGVVTFGEGGVVDNIGVNLRSSKPKLTSDYLTMDVLHPGLAIYDRSMTSFHTLGFSLIADRPGLVMTVRRDVRAYRRDHGEGALLVHYQNALGKKEQLVTLRSG